MNACAEMLAKPAKHEGIVSLDSEIVGRHDLVNPREQLGLGHAARLLGDDGSVSVHEERRDASHTELSGGGGVLFGVDLGDENLSLLSHCGQNGSNGLAGSAPGRPKVNDDPLGFVDGIVEFAVADVPYFTHGVHRTHGREGAL